MNKKIKITLYIAFGFILVGGILGAIGFFQGGYEEISGTGSATKAADLISDENLALEPFDSIACNTDLGEVTVKRGDSYGISLTNYTKESIPKYEVKEGVLTVTSPKIEERITFNSHGPNVPYYGVSITIPADKDMSSVALNSEDGNVFVNALKADTIDIICSYSDIDLTTIDASNLTITTDSGAIKMNGITATTAAINSDYGDLNLSNYTGTTLAIVNEVGSSKIEKLNVENTTIESSDGTIKVDDINGKTLNVTGDTGDATLTTVNIEDSVVTMGYGGLSVNSINGNNLTLSSLDGNMDITKGVLQGTLKANADSGSIKATEMETKGLNVKSSWGTINLNGNFLGKSDIEVESGDVSIYTKTPEELYSYALKTQEYGNVKVNGEIIEGTLIVKAQTENQINITNDSGDISLDFGK